MNWASLLNGERLERPEAETQEGRNPFQQDIDRIVFSAAFRRLAHKTQVHPLADNDHVHTRLTHSIEVSSVGRSLGTIVGYQVIKRHSLTSFTADMFGYVVQAACLAHDIGNPPFGHSGEAAIRDWFSGNKIGNEITREKLNPNEANDFLNFEGNAQGFRILTQLENNKWAGGLQLTFSVLGTFTKYPHSSSVHPIQHDNYIGGKKIGFFHSELAYFQKIATQLALIKRPEAPDYWCRHPLAFLVEAADDICYAIIDIEDGYELGYLTFREAQDILAPVAGDRAGDVSSLEPGEAIGKLRAVAIGKLVEAVAEVFIKHESQLLSGTFGAELIAHTPYSEAAKTAKNIARQKIYWSERKTKIEIAGSEIIGGLLDIFTPILEEFERARWEAEKLSSNAQRLLRLLPIGFSESKNYYDATLRITDFISGMTDRYALDLYRKLKGIAI